MSCHPQFPDYYLYQKDGVWFRTDNSLTKDISSHIFGLSDKELPKMEFIPNWSSKGLPGAKYVAWKVNRFGEQVVRWYWKVGDHTKKCGQCIRLDNGNCAIKAPAMIEWNQSGNCWSLSAMPDKATVEEAKVLDER